MDKIRCYYTKKNGKLCQKPVDLVGHMCKKHQAKMMERCRHWFPGDVKETLESAALASGSIAFLGYIIEALNWAGTLAGKLMQVQEGDKVIAPSEDVGERLGYESLYETFTEWQRDEIARMHLQQFGKPTDD